MLVRQPQPQGTSRGPAARFCCLSPPVCRWPTHQVGNSPLPSRRSSMMGASITTARATAAKQRRSQSRSTCVKATAMVNVDFASPSLLLGTALVLSGVTLLQLRNANFKLTQDSDIVVSAMITIVGSTLVFQGWRLDPLLLLCQALTTSVAVWYGMEAFRMRAKEYEANGHLLPPPPGATPSDIFNALFGGQQQQQQPPYQQQQDYYGYSQDPAQQQHQQQQPGGYLPPSEDRSFPWASPSTQSTQGAWGGSQGVPADVVPSSSGSSGGIYGETIRYDYYGNPLEPLPTAAAYDDRYAQQAYPSSATSGSPGAPLPPAPATAPDAPPYYSYGSSSYSPESLAAADAAGSSSSSSNGSGGMADANGYYPTSASASQPYDSSLQAPLGYSDYHTNPAMQSQAASTSGGGDVSGAPWVGAGYGYDYDYRGAVAEPDLGTAVAGEGAGGGAGAGPGPYSSPQELTSAPLGAAAVGGGHPSGSGPGLGSTGRPAAWGHSATAAGSGSSSAAGSMMGAGGSSSAATAAAAAGTRGGSTQPGVFVERVDDWE